MPVCLGALVPICFVVVVVILPLLLHRYLEATSEDVTKTRFQMPGRDRYLDRYWRRGPDRQLTSHFSTVSAMSGILSK